MFKILPISLHDRDLAQLQRAVRCVNTVQHGFEYELVAATSWPSQRSIVWPTQLPPNVGAGDIIAFTSLPFEDNWFSHRGRGFSIVSTDSWSDLFAPPGLASFMMMEIALATLACFADSTDEAFGPHESPIGCLMDLCDDKRDISWKLRCGSICAEHEGRFRQNGGSARQLRSVQRILEAVRMTAFGRLAFDDLPASRPTPKLFIGSSGATKSIAFAVQSCIESQCQGVECTVWTDSVFEPSSNCLSTLLARAESADFAVLVAGRDDMAVWRGDSVSIPRDNVTFELGLFMGSLGKERTFLVCPDPAPKLPTDLDGITHIRYRERTDNNWLAAVRPGVEAVVSKVRDLGVRDRWAKLLAHLA